MPDIQTLSEPFSLNSFLSALDTGAQPCLPSGLSPTLRDKAQACLARSHEASFTPSQADQVIDTLWSLCLAMVDLAYRSTPVDNALAARKRDGAPCGQVSKNPRSKCDRAGGAVLPSSYSETDNDDTVRKASGLPCGKGDA